MYYERELTNRISVSFEVEPLLEQRIKDIGDLKNTHY